MFVQYAIHCAYACSHCFAYMYCMFCTYSLYILHTPTLPHSLINCNCKQTRITSHRFWVCSHCQSSGVNSAGSTGALAYIDKKMLSYRILLTAVPTAVHCRKCYENSYLHHSCPQLSPCKTDKRSRTTLTAVYSCHQSQPYILSSLAAVIGLRNLGSVPVASATATV